MGRICVVYSPVLRVMLKWTKMSDSEAIVSFHFENCKDDLPESEEEIDEPEPDTGILIIMKRNFTRLRFDK